MSRFLDVFLHARRVGQLEQDGSGNLWFQYASDWLAEENAIALSVSLPLQKERFNRARCRPFFAGLLPESGQRQLIARVLSVSEGNDFALLDKIGGECAGAVSFLPRGTALPDRSSWAFQPVTELDLDEKIGELPKRPLLSGQKGLRLSLAGAQSKMALTIRPEGYAIPLHGAPSSHILKPQSPLFDNLVENEFFCMELARVAGLNVARVSLGKTPRNTFLQVERYDRLAREDGSLERLHQEDFCQSLGVAPERKYQEEGGPNLRQCFDLVRAHCSVPAVDLLHLLDAVFFNCLIGNGDAHGKNFSLLYRNNQIRLAPLYDLVCTHAYPELDSRFAMKIGRERDPAKIRAVDFETLAHDAKLNPKAAMRRMGALLKKTEQMLNAGSALPVQAQVVACIRRNISWIRGCLPAS
jgi:serine/threonine-protein kinase HipA